MPSKNSKPLREKLFEEYEDSLFKLAMHDLAAEEGKSFLKENEKLKNNPDFQPSEAACQKFNQQLNVHLRKNKARSSKLPMSKLVSRFMPITSSVILFITAFGIRQWKL